MRWLAGIDTCTFLHAYSAVDRDASDGSLCLFLDLLLGLRSTVPMAEKESALCDLFLELLPCIDLADAFVTELESLCVDIVLDIVEKVCDNLRDAFLRMRSLLTVSRRASSTVPFSRSRPPIARRTGTPLSSHSANLKPGRRVSRLSILTVMPFASSSFLNAAILSRIALFTASSFPVIGTITTWIGASFGGSTRPLSSPCAMISAPIRRVETPHEVAHTYSC